RLGQAPARAAEPGGGGGAQGLRLQHPRREARPRDRARGADLPRPPDLRRARLHQRPPRRAARGAEPRGRRRHRLRLHGDAQVTLSDVAIKKPVFAWMLMLSLLLFGAISFRRLGVSQNPDVDSPIANVQLTWEGAAPEVMENEIIDPIEEALMSV